ncbi:MAG: 16S rRNA processing protein RimM [Clostridiales bacterium]|nr:16S rRNA processing protein RimM [Clostridiales bacterium]
MEEKLNVATVLKPQGIRGEIKVKVFLDYPEDFKSFKRIFIGGEEYSVLSVRTQGDFAFAAVKGIADRNAAELLRGKEIEVLRSDCPPLPEGRYYIADLLGCEVFYTSGEKIGEVKEVVPAGTDIYVLSTAKGEVSFAAADGVIEDVDVETKKITVNKKRFKEVSV